jgi:hypothetical protein
MISPTIAEVNIRRDTLRDTLVHLITAFETENGVVVDSISIDHHEVTSFGTEKRAVSLGRVEISVRL